MSDSETIRENAIEAVARVRFYKMYGDGYDDPENWAAREVTRDFARPLVDAVLTVVADALDEMVNDADSNDIHGLQWAYQVLTGHNPTFDSGYNDGT